MKYRIKIGRCLGSWVQEKINGIDIPPRMTTSSYAFYSQIMIGGMWFTIKLHKKLDDAEKFIDKFKSCCKDKWEPIKSIKDGCEVLKFYNEIEKIIQEALYEI